MTVLIVLAVILCLVILLLMTGVKINVISKGDTLVRVGAGPLMIKVYPSKEKKIKLRSFTQEKYLKLMKKEEPEEVPEEKPAKEKKPKGSIARTIGLVKKILDRLDTYTGRIYTKISYLKVVVGGKDAAGTAVTYGVVSQSVSYLIELLDCKTKLKTPNAEKLSVVCDYTADGVTFGLDLTIKIRIIDALKTAVDVLMIKFKHDSEAQIKNINNNSNKRKVGNENGRKQAERNH